MKLDYSTPKGQGIMSKKVLVVGGGAAGLLAAAEAAKNGADVTVAERN